MPPLRVFYNASALPPRPAGAGIYTLELGRALAAREDTSLTVAAPRQVDFGEWRPSPPGRARRLAWELAGLGRALRQSRADVYHGPHFVTPRTSIPTVATVHDLTFFRRPRRYGFTRLAYYRGIARSARRADRLIVPSAAVARDAVRYLGYDPSKIRVIAEAPRAGLCPATGGEVERFRDLHGLGSPYLACLGTAEPGKRAVDAIRALPAVLERAPGVLLALAGNAGKLTAALQHEAERLKVAGSVRFLGYLPDEELAAFLTGAETLVFPSLYEGFGLPPLEAMACGTPAIATDAPAMREVLRGAATFVPVGDPAAIAREVVKLLAAPALRAERSAAAREFAARFSWTRAAEETADVYRELTQ